MYLPPLQNTKNTRELKTGSSNLKKQMDKIFQNKTSVKFRIP